MKKSIILLAGVAICYPLYLGADTAAMKTDIRNNLQMVKKPQLFSCPDGWTKVLDIINEKSKWSESTSVLICKPAGDILKCPPGTFPYMENCQGHQRNSGEIGCKIPVQ